MMYGTYRWVFWGCSCTIITMVKMCNCERVKVVPKIGHIAMYCIEDIGSLALHDHFCYRTHNPFYL